MIDITEADYLRFKQLHRNISYTQEEANWMLAMTHKFVDPNARVCPTCSSSISALKQRIYGWLWANEQEIINQLYPPAPEVDDLTKAQQEVQNYSNDGTEQ